ncbi:MAG TPA: carboxypeptidase-like regulatory domain-containing protein [Burkholderiales bacterium]
MRLSSSRYLAFALLLACAHAQAGGEMGDPDHVDEGTPYFGFVKDADGRAIYDAKVVAVTKDGTRLIARTATNGMYNFGSLNKDLKPDDVAISCTKDGYKPLRIFRRPPSSTSTNKAVETECRLQKG